MTDRRCTAITLALALAGFSLLAVRITQAAQLITQTLKEKPAVLVAAFGTSTKAQATYDAFDHQLKEALPGHEVRWAFTSEIIREKVNARRAKEGVADRLKSVPQALADLQAEGYTRVAVQPLHILPGEEYEEVLQEVRGFPGLRIEVGETLLHRWENVRAVLGILARDFVAPDQGCNVIVAHGSPTTAAPTNTALLGIERYVTRTYPNAYLGSVEGIVTREDALSAAKAHPGKRVRFLPLLFVGGDHAMNDVMGGDRSWRAEMAAAGKEVDMPTVELAGETQYRGLGLLPEVNRIFVREIERTLARL